MTSPVDVDAVPVAWREAGTGADAVLLLHGLGGSRTAWEPQFAAWSDTWRCVAWDCPGYGASAPVDALTFPLLADAVAALLDRLGVERAHLVGLSFGGMKALHVAIRHPDRTGCLVLASTSPAFGLDGTDPAAWKRSRLEGSRSGREILTAIAAPGFGGGALEASVAAFDRISRAALAAAVDCLPTHDVRDQLAEITAPTLVVSGALDSETPPSYGRALAEAIPGAQLVVVPGAGHLVPAEAPDAFNRLVRSFLTQEAVTRG